MQKKRAKGIGLLSGGLDSILAVKVLQDQDLDLTGLVFSTPFFGLKPGMRADEVAGIPTRVIDIGEKHLEMLRSPRYGFGSQMNPCIDCHALMLREAGKIMEQEAADFLFTGEVVGQRPMSQRRDALKSVEKLAGYPGRVLRPLSAKLLDPTLVEEQGLVDRDRLLDIHGRSRKRQEALARHYGIKEYPQPGGGCMLTKEGFAKRLRQLMRSYPHAGVREVETLKWGRLFLLPGGAICIVGRHQPDNTRLNELARDEDIVLHAVEHPGPTALLLASPKADEDLELAAMILLSYSDAPTGRISTVEWKHNGKAFRITYKKTARDRYQKYLI